MRKIQYPYTVYFAEANGRTFWVVESLDLKGCAAQGASIEDALTTFAETERDWLDAATLYDIPIPKLKPRPLDGTPGATAHWRPL